MRAKQYVAAGVRVKLKTSAFQLLSRQQLIDPPTDLAEVLFDNACKLARRFATRGPFRLVGLATFALGKRGELSQLELFYDAPRPSKLEATIDALNSKFGKDAIRRARDLGESGTVMGNAPTLDFRDTGEDAEESHNDFDESDGN